MPHSMFMLERHHPFKVGEFALVVITASFAVAYVDTIWALFINSFVNSDAMVSFVSSILKAAMLLMYFYFIPLFQKNQASKLYVTSLAMLGFSYFMFMVTDDIYHFMTIALIMMAGWVLRVGSRGIVLRDLSTKKNIPKNEGLIFTTLNIAWMVGPLVAGFLSDRYGFNAVFFVSFLFIVIAILMWWAMRVNIKDPPSKTVDKDIRKNMHDFLSNKKLFKIFTINLSLGAEMSITYIFVPLYIISSGYSVLWVGLYLFATKIPLIMFEYFIGKQEETSGVKKYLRYGLIIMSVMSFLAFLSTIFLNNVVLTLSLLVVARIGFAFVEPTADSYFFRVTTRSEEQKFYGPFRTSIPLGGIILQLVASVVLLVLPITYVFLIFPLMILPLLKVTKSLRRV